MKHFYKIPISISCFLIFVFLFSIPQNSRAGSLTYIQGASYIMGTDTTTFPLNWGDVKVLPNGGTLTFTVIALTASFLDISLCSDTLPEGATFPCVRGLGVAVSVFTWTPTGAFSGRVRFITNNTLFYDLYFDVIMPVELSAFTSDIYGNSVNLKWQTVSENNNSRYEIERTKLINENIQGWIMVGSVTGNGTTSSPSDYTFTDRALNEGSYKYRLKQIDFNGNSEYYYLTNNVQIGVPSRFELSQNYPNPFNPSTVINYNLALSNDVSLKVYNSSGMEVKTLIDEFKNAGYYSLTFDGKDLSSGVYYYKIVSGSFVSVKKMMLLK